MKRLAVLFCVAALAALTGTAALRADPPSRVGRLNLVEGAVSFKPGSLDDWAPAALNYPLTTGDRLWTEPGARAEIHVGEAAIRLGPGTELSVLLLDDKTVQLSLTQGSLNVRLRGLDPDESFEVAAPDGSVALLRTGSYRIDVQEDGSTEVSVMAGEAELASGASSVTVSPGQSVGISDPDSAAFDFRHPSPPDGFDAWCLSRDQREDRLSGAARVPGSMIGYEDLDESGVWQVVGGFGTVWAPRSVPAGWAPYRFGHWAWVEPWGWTWIDDAPWGFAPFHYGRWAFAAGRWVWVPGAATVRPVYAPALVAFIGGANGPGSLGEGIAWFPLGPQEIYVPPYQVSTVYVRAVNISSVTEVRIELVDVTRIRYVNRAVAGAVTVVPRRAFVGAEPVARAVFNVPRTELQRAPVTGMSPFLVPARESVLARPVPGGVQVPRPPAGAVGRPVIVRREPPPPPMAFDERQRQLKARPGMPLETAPYPEPRNPGAQGAAGRTGFKVLGAPGSPQQSPGQRVVAPEPQGRGAPAVTPAPGGAPVMQGPPPRQPRQPVQPQQPAQPAKPGGPGRVATPQPARPAQPGQTQDRGQPADRGQPQDRGQFQPQGGPDNNPPAVQQGRGQGKPGQGAGPVKKKKMKLVNGKWVEVEEDSGDRGPDDQGSR